MKVMTQSIMAAALLLALPFAASAQATCTTNAWNGNTPAAGAAVAAGPASATPQRRYSEFCSVGTPAGAFVTDNTPNAESTFRKRVYLFTSGSGKFFSATAANSGAGAEVYGLSYTGGNIVVSGASGTSPIPATAQRWYSIESVMTGGNLTVTVQGAGSDTPATTSGTGVVGTVESASIGLIGSGTGVFQLDDYVSTRSATTPIGRLCKGDTNGDGSRNVSDALRARAEFVSGGTSPTSGQPDVNEDGSVTITDAILMRNLFVGGQSACPAA